MASIAGVAAGQPNAWILLGAVFGGFLCLFVLSGIGLALVLSRYQRRRRAQAGPDGAPYDLVLAHDEPPGPVPPDEEPDGDRDRT